MMHPEVANTGHLLVVLSVIVPIAGALICTATGGRAVERVAFVALAATAAITGMIVVEALSTHRALDYVLGGWEPPLGVALRVDGLSVVMMATSAVVIIATAIFARQDFATSAYGGETRS